MDGLGTPILDGIVFQNKPVEGFYSHVTCVLVNDLHVSSFFKIWAWNCMFHGGRGIIGIIALLSVFKSSQMWQMS